MSADNRVELLDLQTIGVITPIFVGHIHVCALGAAQFYHHPWAFFSHRFNSLINSFISTFPASIVDSVDLGKYALRAGAYR
jgi:hypothetical protein